MGWSCPWASSRCGGGCVPGGWGGAPCVLGFASGGALGALGGPAGGWGGPCWTPSSASRFRPPRPACAFRPPPPGAGRVHRLRRHVLRRWLVVVVFGGGGSSRRRWVAAQTL